MKISHNRAPEPTYHFILDETIESKRLITPLFQIVNRFTPCDFRFNQPMLIIVSIIMKRFVDK
jgi:hypothetical protein